LDFQNTTPVPARVLIADAPEGPERIVTVIAKATFRVGDEGVPVLDTETPVPILDADEQTDLGILPSDLRVRLSPGFEVMVLGKAYSPTGGAVPEVIVSLRVGRTLRRLLITGDRFWIGRDETRRIGPAVPFKAMVLDWSRAFGGTIEVQIDEGAAIDVADPRNREGRGFDHLAQAEALAAMFGCPDGYPIFPEGRDLPNIEDPDDRLEEWDDEPLPVCWSPCPVSSGILTERLARRFGPHGLGDVDAQRMVSEPLINERAHPDWVIATPEEQAEIRLEGMLPGHREFRFRMPRARMRLELKAGSRFHEAEAHPRSLILLPEERRFCVVFSGATRFSYDPDETRIARLIAQHGWRPDPGDRIEPKEDGA